MAFGRVVKDWHTVKILCHYADYGYDKCHFVE